MTKAPARIQGLVSHLNIRVTPNSLEFVGAVSDESILEVCGFLGQVGSSLPWYIGDLVKEVKTLRGDARAAAVMQHFKRAESTIYNAWLVCRAWSPELRIDGASFYQHQEAWIETQDLDEAIKWVQLAVKNDWSANEMRRRIRADKQGPEAASKPSSFSDLYSAIRWVKRLDTKDLTEGDKETLRKDLKCLVEFYSAIGGQL